MSVDDDLLAVVRLKRQYVAGTLSIDVKLCHRIFDGIHQRIGSLNKFSFSHNSHLYPILFQEICPPCYAKFLRPCVLSPLRELFRPAARRGRLFCPTPPARVI